MIVPFVAAGTAFFYLCAVPVKIAFCLRAGAERGWGAGISAFENRFARASARRALEKAKRKIPKMQFSLPGGRMPLLKSAAKALGHFLRHARLSAFSLRGAVSLGDAALTALACGAAGSLVSALAAVTRAQTECALQPDFATPQFSFDGEIAGIVTISAGHIMLAALIGAIDYGNGRLSQWTDTRSKTS